MGWPKEAKEILEKGIEKFLDDEELRKFLNDVEDDTDDTDGEKPLLLGMIRLMAILHKKLRRK